MSFTTKECAWHQTSLKILTRTVVGIRGFEFNTDHEDEYLYAAGNKPIDIQSGNDSYPGNVKLLKYELDMLNDAARVAGYPSISKVPHELIVITCVYKKAATDPARTITAAGVKFGSQKYAMEQNGKFTEVTVPFLSMDTVVK